MFCTLPFLLSVDLPVSLNFLMVALFKHVIEKFLVLFLYQKIPCRFSLRPVFLASSKIRSIYTSFLGQQGSLREPVLHVAFSLLVSKAAYLHSSPATMKGTSLNAVLLLVLTARAAFAVGE